MNILNHDDTNKLNLVDFLDQSQASGGEVGTAALLGVLEGCKPSVKGLTKLLSLLRNKEAYDLSSHTYILDALKTTILLDSPPALHFPGDPKSYIQLPSIDLSDFQEAFTLSLWMRLEDDGDGHGQMKTSLFRCRSPQGGVEGILSEHQADGRCKLTMKVYCESDSSGHQSEQISGTVFLARDTWHLVTFSQSALYGMPIFKCFVDSNLEMEHELAYPFQQCPAESLWSFGAGLRGQVASLVLYAAAVPASLLRLHAEAGPLTPSLDTGVTHPQGSFDSGHCLLGTQLTKGQDALRASHSSPIFVFTAKHFSPHKIGRASCRERV